MASPLDPRLRQKVSSSERKSVASNQDSQPLPTLQPSFFGDSSLPAAASTTNIPPPPGMVPPSTFHQMTRPLFYPHLNVPFPSPSGATVGNFQLPAQENVSAGSASSLVSPPPFFFPPPFPPPPLPPALAAMHFASVLESSVLPFPKAPLDMLTQHQTVGKPADFFKQMCSPEVSSSQAVCSTYGQLLPPAPMQLSEAISRRSTVPPPGFPPHGSRVSTAGSGAPDVQTSKRRRSHYGAMVRSEAGEPSLKRRSSSMSDHNGNINRGRRGYQDYGTGRKSRDASESLQSDSFRDRRSSGHGSSRRASWSGGSDVSHRSRSNASSPVPVISERSFSQDSSSTSAGKRGQRHSYHDYYRREHKDSEKDSKGCRDGQDQRDSKGCRDSQDQGYALESSRDCRADREHSRRGNSLSDRYLGKPDKVDVRSRHPSRSRGDRCQERRLEDDKTEQAFHSLSDTEQHHRHHRDNDELRHRPRHDNNVEQSPVAKIEMLLSKCASDYFVSTEIEANVGADFKDTCLFLKKEPQESKVSSSSDASRHSSPHRQLTEEHCLKESAMEDCATEEHCPKESVMEDCAPVRPAPAETIALTSSLTHPKEDSVNMGNTFLEECTEDSLEWTTFSSSCDVEEQTNIMSAQASRTSTPEGKDVEMEHPANVEMERPANFMVVEHPANVEMERPANVMVVEHPANVEMERPANVHTADTDPTETCGEDNARRLDEPSSGNLAASDDQDYVMSEVKSQLVNLSATDSQLVEDKSLQSQKVQLAAEHDQTSQEGDGTICHSPQHSHQTSGCSSCTSLQTDMTLVDIETSSQRRSLNIEESTHISGSPCVKKDPSQKSDKAEKEKTNCDISKGSMSGRRKQKACFVGKTPLHELLQEFEEMMKSDKTPPADFSSANVDGDASDSQLSHAGLEEGELDSDLEEETVRAGGHMQEEDDRKEGDNDQRGPLARSKESVIRAHKDLWYNVKGQNNDGPVCSCPVEALKEGILHNVYPGEKGIPRCDPNSNNAHRLFFYRVNLSPLKNFATSSPTRIIVDGVPFEFDGFGLLSHEDLSMVPAVRVFRFNIEYVLSLEKEPMPQYFTIACLNVFHQFVFNEVLELYDWDLFGQFDEAESCPRFHLYPRFTPVIPDCRHGPLPVLSMDRILDYLLMSRESIYSPKEPFTHSPVALADELIICPFKRPACIRLDRLEIKEGQEHPSIIHFGIRPVQHSYAGDPRYQKLSRAYYKYRHQQFFGQLTREDVDAMVQTKYEMEQMREERQLRRDIVVHVDPTGYKRTGLKSDVTQWAMMMPVICHHVRHFLSLTSLDDLVQYTFKDRALLTLALTHPSYHLNYAVNPDQARNALSNCGVREPAYGDRRVVQLLTRKKGMNKLYQTMGKQATSDSISAVQHYERLEFLGDAVLEYLCSVHLFLLFPDMQEGHLSIFRTAIVQNKNLASIAERLHLRSYMLYSHGPDMSDDAGLKNAMANCFESLLGAIFLESGLTEATKFLSTHLFADEPELKEIWRNYPLHPLQEDKPCGDRDMISGSLVLQDITKLEEKLGIRFRHIRLLAKALTHPQVGYNNLTFGHNQRLEFLGDSIVQFVTSQYLYRHFPDHHEGHLTLLRSILVSNRTLARVASELGLVEHIYVGQTNSKLPTRPKLLADLLEAFIAALLLDRGMKVVIELCNIVLLPRLPDMIVKREWIDAKTQLQQSCLTLRRQGHHIIMPLYKLLEEKGPAHNKVFTVGVFFKKKRIGVGSGQSLQAAEMEAAQDALESRAIPRLRQMQFPVEKSFKAHRQYD